jgi:hypothetical protein
MTIKTIATSFPTKMACECELLSNSNGEIHSLPEGDLDICTNFTYFKVEDKHDDYVWLCAECMLHNC